MNTVLPPACPDTIPLLDLWHPGDDGRVPVGCPAEVDLPSYSPDKDRMATSAGPVRPGERLADAQCTAARPARTALRGGVS